MEEIRKVHQYLVFSVNTPAQHAIAAFINQPRLWQVLAQFYQRKRDLFIKGLAESDFKLLSCEGNYFSLTDYRRISTETGLAFIYRLIKDSGAIAMPLSSFYYGAVKEPPIVRFCFAKQDDTLHTAAQRLSAFTSLYST